jgi:hypothetical protein
MCPDSAEGDRSHPDFWAALEAPEEAQRLRPFERPALDRDPSTIYAVDGDLRLVYMNPAWFAFARANGARWEGGEWGLGSSILEATAKPLRRAYERMFARARLYRSVVEHEYECPSATTFRRYAMRIHPCDSDVFVVVHRLLVQEAHHRPARSPLEWRYRDADGIIKQCAHCRCVQRASMPGCWDWVPTFVAEVPRAVSHGLCRVCCDYFYPAYDGAG